SGGVRHGPRGGSSTGSRAPVGSGQGGIPEEDATDTADPMPASSSPMERVRGGGSSVGRSPERKGRWRGTTGGEDDVGKGGGGGGGGGLLRMSCDRCSLKKVKCSGDMDTCSRCLKDNVECHYTCKKQTGPKKGMRHNQQQRQQEVQQEGGYGSSFNQQGSRPVSAPPGNRGMGQGQGRGQGSPQRSPARGGVEQGRGPPMGGYPVSNEEVPSNASSGLCFRMPSHPTFSEPPSARHPRSTPQQWNGAGGSSGTNHRGLDQSMGEHPPQHLQEQQGWWQHERQQEPFHRHASGSHAGGVGADAGGDTSSSLPSESHHVWRGGHDDRTVSRHQESHSEWRGVADDEELVQVRRRRVARMERGRVQEEEGDGNQRPVPYPSSNRNRKVGEVGEVGEHESHMDEETEEEGRGEDDMRAGGG
ncbi:unnamed protein product, partial [Choristocarpus tenellus]